FSSVNFGKEYRWMDLSLAENREDVEALIQWSDIVIVNFKEGDDLKFQLTAQDIHTLQPQAIYASLKGFKSDAHRIAYDVVLQAESGFMFMNGNESSGPLKMPVALIDVIAAHQLKEGILCALIQREKTGKGSVVRTTLEESALSALVNQASNYLMEGHIAQAQGSLHPNIAPYGETFICSDGKHLVLAVGSDSQFRQLCETVNLPELSKDERFSTNHQRVIHREQLASLLAPFFQSKSRTEWVEEITSRSIPAGAIRSMDEVLSTNVGQRMIREEMIDGRPTRRLSGISFTMES
ncbi:MAG: CaiB/BaiF CoA transferase family protein, partial [Flavobacteriales bacterium]